MADEQLRDDVKQLLDNIDWNSVSEFENLRATVERNPQIAEQLAYGEMTDLVRATSKTITGQFSLRAIPNGEGKPWALRMYNIEKKPDPAKEDIYYKGSKITSPDILRGLFERTLRKYDHGLSVGVVGGFGYAGKDILIRLGKAYGIRFSRFLSSPTEGLVEYHAL